MIGVVMDESIVRLGEFVTGHVFWSQLDGETIRVQLRWEAAGLATHASFAIVREVAHEVGGDGDGRLPFRWKLPHEGPMSIEGIAVSVKWTVRAEVRHGLLPADRAEAEFRALAGVRSASGIVEAAPVV